MPRLPKGLLKFLIVGVTALAVQTVTFTVVLLAVVHLAGRAAPNIWPQACLLAGAAFATLFSYSGQRFFTFAPQRLASHDA